MFRVERITADGDVQLMRACPHRIGIGDLAGPPGPHPTNQMNGAQYMNGWPTPGNATVFAGMKGWEARVRYNDTVIERFVWDKIPVNEFDPDSDTLWGWKLVEQNHQAIPFEALWPLSFVG